MTIRQDCEELVSVSAASNLTISSFRAQLPRIDFQLYEMKSLAGGHLSIPTLKTGALPLMHILDYRCCVGFMELICC